jgi:hypothetical protein
LRGQGEYAVEGSFTTGSGENKKTYPFGLLKSEEGHVCIPVVSPLEFCITLDTDPKFTDDSGISHFLSMVWGSGSGALKLTMRAPDPSKIFCPDTGYCEENLMSDDTQYKINNSCPPPPLAVIYV